jgi:hypothetical protein
MQLGVYAHNPAAEAAVAAARKTRQADKLDRVNAALSRMAAREAVAQTATGEICRCPESRLDCICGAYPKTEVA